jgi:hypothetical protein
MVQGVRRELEMRRVPFDSKDGQVLFFGQNVETVFLLAEFHQFDVIAVLVVFEFCLGNFFVEKENLVACHYTHKRQGYNLEHVSDLEFFFRLVP